MSHCINGKSPLEVETVGPEENVNLKSSLRTSNLNNATLMKSTLAG